MGGVFDLSFGAVGVADELPGTSHTTGDPGLIQEPPRNSSGEGASFVLLASYS